jgi:S-adenosylmethionine hydrolase
MSGVIVLFTDFGASDPYVGQVHAVLRREAPGVPVIDLLNEAPAYDVAAAGCLLPALAAEFEAGTVFLCVVDPGVGGPRRALALELDGRWYAGPDNGLFTLAARRARLRRAFEITWRPPRLSTSFHGRDLFAPVAARLAAGSEQGLTPCVVDDPGPVQCPDDPPRVVYVDHFGNAMTGVRAATIPALAAVHAAGQRLSCASTFGSVAPGEAFWYANSIGLVEIAVNRGSAAQVLGLRIGDPIEVLG